MGSGKSSVGPALARELGRDFVDNDRRVEELAGSSIPEIFEHRGEAGFRALEAQAIDEGAGTNAVVALGGGAIAQPGAAEKLAGNGTLVYLQASVDVLLRRVGNAASRPLLAGLDRQARRERIEQMLNEREGAYRRASIVVETDGMSVSDVVCAIAAEFDVSAGETGDGSEGA